MGLGKVQKLVGPEGVGGSGGSEVVDESHRGGDAGDMLLHLTGFRLGDPFVAYEEVDRGALEIQRHFGAEFEAVELDLHRRRISPAFCESGHACFPFALADIAPRANDIGPDIHFDWFEHCSFLSVRRSRTE